MSKTRKPERFILRVIKGALEPVDSYTAARLRDKGYHIGDLISATLTKPRNPKFHRMAFALLNMVVENIEAFAGLDPHTALKRLQIESGVACEEIGMQVKGFGYAMVKYPDSISFASKDEGEFKEIIRGLSRHIAATYWHGLTPEQIEAMAGVMVDE